MAPFAGGNVACQVPIGQRFRIGVGEGGQALLLRVVLMRHGHGF
jgi:hypothetical protein